MPGKVSREVDIETNKPLAASEDVLINSVLEDMTDSQQLNMEQELDEVCISIIDNPLPASGSIPIISWHSDQFCPMNR